MATARRAAPAARTQSRPAARGSSRSNAAPRGSSGYSGAAGRAKMQEEAEKAEARKAARAAQGYAPFRFFMQPGETKDIIVVDEEPNFFRHEHQMKGPSGRWDLFLPCIAEHNNCPACDAASDKQPYFAMYLTIIDLTEYENKDGELVPWSKKLLVVKPQQQKKLMRIFEREGTLRGALLHMTRDGDKDASIGNEIEFDGFYSEDELEQYVDSYQDKDKKTIEVIGYECYDYDEIFPALSEEEIAASVGGRVNNRASHERNVRGADRDDWGRDGRQSRSRPAARSAPSRSRQQEADDDQQQDDDPQEAAPTRRTARSAAPAPAARRPASRPAPRHEEQDDDQQDDDGEQPESLPPPRRAAAAPAARRPATRPAAREQDGDQQDEAQDDPPQRRPASSLADRRRALRQGR